MENWISLAGIGGGGLLGAIYAYKKLRPRFPVKVNCWFCDQNTIVPYGNQNCWDCPHCDQYNGFDEKGDYNKPIPAQLNGDLNYPVSCKKDEYIGSGCTLCPECERNQLLKVKQLAAFVPMIEANYDTEVEAYRAHLEKVYMICPTCQEKVKREIQKQDDALRSKLIGSKFDTSNMSDTSVPMETESLSQSPMTPRTISSQIVGCTTVLCSIFCLIASLEMVTSSLPAPLSAVVESLCMFTAKSVLQVAVCAGLFLCLLSKILLGKERLYLVDALSCYSWLVGVLIYTDLVSEISWINTPAFCNAVSMVIVASSLLALGWKRDLRSATTKSFKRLSLDKSTASNQSETDTVAVSSVSTSRKAQPDIEDDIPRCDMSDLDLEFDAVSLGPPLGQLKKQGSGLFSSSLSLNSFASTSTLSSIPQNRQHRPLITPAKLNVLQFTSSVPYATSQDSTSLVNRCAHLADSGTLTPFGRKTLSESFSTGNSPGLNLFTQTNLTAEKLSLFSGHQTSSIFSSSKSLSQPVLGQSRIPTSSLFSQLNHPQTSGPVDASHEKYPNTTPKSKSLWKQEKFGQTDLGTGTSGQTDSSDLLRWASLGNVKVGCTTLSDSILGEAEPANRRLGQTYIIDNRQQRSHLLDDSVSKFGFEMTTPHKKHDFISAKLKILSAEKDGDQESHKTNSTETSECLVDSTSQPEQDITPDKKDLPWGSIAFGTLMAASILGNGILGVYLFNHR